MPLGSLSGRPRQDGLQHATADRQRFIGEGETVYRLGVVG